MTYNGLVQSLQDKGFNRVERDDRLLDVFPAETLEKGIELWEKWEENAVRIARIRLPFNGNKNTQLISIPRRDLEQLLLRNEVKNITQFPAQPLHIT